MKYEKAVKADCFPYMCTTRINKTLGLIHIQIAVKEKALNLFGETSLSWDL